VGVGDLQPPMLRRDGPAEDVLERLAAAFVRARVRPLAAGAIHAHAASRAGLLRFTRRTITGQPVTITALEHRPFTNQGGERPVERSCRNIGGGLDLTVSAMIYSMIRRAQEEGSAEPVRSYLRTLRDIGYFKGIPLPDADGDLLEFASVQVAESITSGMSDCTPTLSAACSLLDDGKKVGGAGDFRFGSEPGSLVGAAYYQLALLVSRKEPVRECEECKALFVPKDPRQIEHKTCGNRKRQRKLRRDRRAE
jgi:hypothetical protein